MRIAITLLAWLGLCASKTVFAHGEHARHWNEPGALSVWDLCTVSLLVAAGFLYVAGLRRLRERGVRPSRHEPVSCALGWFALMAAALPPLDALAIERFSVHMVQHELIMLVGAPLLAAGRPLAICLWGLPSHARRAVGHTLQQPLGASLQRGLTTPVLPWAAHGIAIWVWHVPALYGAAVQSEGIHTLQHATFAVTAGLFWWGLLAGRYGRAGYGAAVFYVFTTAVHTGLLGAMLTLAPRALYPVYFGPARAHGVDPLLDQQMAGLLMWIPAGVLLTLVGIAIFAAWLAAAERRQPVSGRPSTARH